MRHKGFFASALALALALAPAGALAGCGGGSGAADSSQASATSATSAAPGQETSADAGGAASEAAALVVSADNIPDGSYEIVVDTDSGMFRSERCLLKAEGGVLTAELTLPGEGFSRLFFGTAEEAARAQDADIYDFRLDDEGKYTFDIPVPALDEELTIAAYGQRRDRWYDHTITFHAPVNALLSEV